MLCLWVQMRGSGNPGGSIRWLAAGPTYAKPSLASTPLYIVRVRVRTIHPFFCWFRVHLCVLLLVFVFCYCFPLLSVVFASFFVFMFSVEFCRCSSHIFLPTRPVPHRHPRILLALVEARSVNSKNIHTRTLTFDRLRLVGAGYSS